MRAKASIPASASCVYCCGTRASETRDHNPARSFFRRHGAPKGFVFPACKRCNALKKNDESRFSMMAGVLNLHDPADGDHWNDVMRRAYAHLTHDDEFRAAIEQVKDSELDPRSSLAEPSAGRGLFPIAPRVELPDKFYASAIRIGLWLGLSLYHRATREICPSDTQIGVRVFTNLDLSEGLPELSQLLAMLTRETPLTEKRGLTPMFSWAHRLFDTREGAIAAELHGCILWVIAINRGGFDRLRVADSHWFAWQGDWTEMK